MNDDKQTDEELRSEAEERRRLVYDHISRSKQCRYCLNSGLLMAEDEKKYRYSFVCTFCTSSEIAGLNNSKHFKMWDQSRYRNLIVRFIT